MVTDAAAVPGRFARPHALPHPASDGAHRLGWWIGEQEDSARAIVGLGDAIGAGADLVDRLLSGEVEPSEETAATIAAITEGGVLPGDWRRGGPLGWLERPLSRELPREARP